MKRREEHLREKLGAEKWDGALSMVSHPKCLSCVIMEFLDLWVPYSTDTPDSQVTSS